MLIINHELVSEISVQTVILSANKESPHNTYLFRCYHCGTAISRLKGDIVSINAGLVPSNDVTVVCQCYQCKENYVFQTGKPTDQPTRVTLAPEPNRSLSTFHCVVCRTPLVQYNSEYMAELPKLNEIGIFTRVKCPKLDCLKAYDILDVVSAIIN